MILAIDPGLKGLGCAQLDDIGTLTRGWFIPPPDGLVYDKRSWNFSAQWYAHLDSLFPPGIPGTFVIEGQFIRTHPRPNDILRLSYLTGLIMGLMSKKIRGPVHVALPKQWKGTTPPEVIQQRIYEKLSEDERSRVESPRRSAWYGDILTACGIAKWFHENSKPAS